VNGIDITVAPHDQAVALLTGIRGEISLVVSRDQHDDVAPESSNQGSSSTVTWPTTPLDDADAGLAIVIQPPTPNYAVVESSPSNVAVVKDATDVAMQSAAETEVESGAAAGAEEAEKTVDTDPDLPEHLPPDLIDLNAQCSDFITVSAAAEDIDLQLGTRQLMFGQYDDPEFEVDFYEDDSQDDFWAATVSGVTGSSPMSSDIKDMIQHGMLETLRLL